MNLESWPEFLLHLTGRVTFAAACAGVNAWLYSWIVDDIAWQILNLHPHPHLLYHIYSFWIFLPIFFLIGMFATDLKKGCTITAGFLGLWFWTWIFLMFAGGWD